ncbi:helix-turn-helix domain-containing protein [Nonomuraea sp. C10]|uniref:helix-turn-helix domain-containing protein n=1 Tax=Nonomuraea sp. C10 TaxID=2600577 RepID=UPI001C9CE91A|nr:helix-turn-helix domain-containing protein [Nonomuraea sp. C10]
MADAPRANELSRFLRQLKEQSGHSYEWIGRRVNASKSTVHRYCSGESVPPTFGLIEQIAKACQADKTDLAHLHRLWIRATTPAEESAESQESITVLLRPPREREPVRRAAADGRGVVWTSAGLVIACLLILTASAPGNPAGSPAGVPRITGPSWVRPPAPVPATLFGVTVNSATGAMPSFRIGAVRLWDSATRWSQIQPRRGEFDWSTLDRHVEGAQRSRLPVLFVFGGTPGWASPTGPPAPYPDGSRAAPPDDLADWESFVRAVAGRYRGRIAAYELWVLGNDHRFYSGDIGTLIEMTHRAARIIRRADPEATLVCPGMGRLWSRDGRDALRRFAQLGGYGHCDVASVKLHQRIASDPPETMLELADLADRTLHEAGVHPRLWSTGTSYTLPLERPLDALTARAYAARYFLVGLYARGLNVERMYFYNWGGTKIPIVLQGEGGVPTSAALAVEQLQRWLAHASSRSCGHGDAIGLPANVWRCEVTVTGDGGTHGAAVMWTVAGTAEIPASRDTTTLRRLDGTSHAVRPGDTITVGQEPIFVEG